MAQAQSRCSLIVDGVADRVDVLNQQCQRIGTDAQEHLDTLCRRAADILGLGRTEVRAVPVDEQLRMRPDALAAMLEDDDALPMAVVATAGTTATGAIDPLAALADVAGAHGA